MQKRCLWKSPEEGGKFSVGAQNVQRRPENVTVGGWGEVSAKASI